jgi:hypothetical protein
MYFIATIVVVVVFFWDVCATTYNVTECNELKKIVKKMTLCKNIVQSNEGT